MNTQVLIAFIGYFAILLTIGLVASKKHKTTSESDFIIGDRSLNYWLTALSAQAADMSGWLFMAFPAAIFIGGLPQLWIAIGLICGMFCNWHFVASKLRTATEKTGSYTLSTFFERHYKDNSGVIRVLTALMTMIFMTCYLSGGLIAMGYLFESLFGLDYYFGIVLATAIVMAYTFFGGFVAVAWTDLFQSLFLLMMIILVPMVALGHTGGIEDIYKNADLKSISLNLFPDFSFVSLLVMLSLALGWGLPYFGQPHILTKFMGINNVNEMHKSKYIGMTWQILALVASAFVGLVGIAFFPDGLANGELVFVDMTKSVFSPFLAGLILCAVLAANMSTMDSQILVCASVLSEDLYKHAFAKEATSAQLLKISRFSVILVSIVSLLLAMSKSATVSATVAYAWSGLGSSFGPLVLMSLYSKSANRYGAIAGILVGGVVAGTWPVMSSYITDYAISPTIPGFTLSLLTIYLVSIATNKRQLSNA